MFPIATKRCPGSAVSGARWVLMVAFACLNNLAVAGFAPIASGVTFKAEPQSSVLTMYGFDSAGAGVCESTTTAAASEPSTPAKSRDKVPVQGQGFICLPVGLGECGSAGSAPGGQPTLSLSCSSLSEAAILHAPTLISRLDAFEQIRLPPKLPYKLFRPPKCE